MTILEEAIQKFPIGTKFIGIYGTYSTYTVKDIPYIDREDSVQGTVICVKVNELNDTKDNSAAMYSKERGFSKIIESVNTKPKFFL